MAKSCKCPSCQNETDSGAKMCSNPACRLELAFCPCCRDISTFELAEQRQGVIRRNHYRCNRCQSIGARCLTWEKGGYCNGFSQVGSLYDHPFCPQCASKYGEMARNILSAVLIGIVGNLFRKK